VPIDSTEDLESRLDSVTPAARDNTVYFRFIMVSIFYTSLHKMHHGMQHKNFFAIYLFNLRSRDKL